MREYTRYAIQELVQPLEFETLRTPYVSNLDGTEIISGFHIKIP